MSDTTPHDAELRQKLKSILDTDIPDNDEQEEALIDDLQQLIAERIEAKEKEWLKVYITMLIEAYKGVRPAKPEDLTLSQWHGLVDGIDQGIASAEQSLAELTPPKGTE